VVFIGYAAAFAHAIKERGYPTWEELQRTIKAARAAKWIPAVTERFAALCRLRYEQGWEAEFFWTNMQRGLETAREAERKSDAERRRKQGVNELGQPPAPKKATK
jgi:hypothetical protein